MAATRVWVVSDPHLYHVKVSSIRGFSSPDAFNSVFVSDWIEKVGPKDQVWILGDLTGGGYVEEALNILQVLPGEKHMIIGNHDGCFPGHRNSHRALKKYYRVFESVQLHASRSIGGIRVLVSHFPYSGDHTETSRHMEWRLRDHGIPLVHGHTHSKEPVSKTVHGTVQINVSWEVNNGLVLFDSLYKYL